MNWAFEVTFSDGGKRKFDFDVQLGFTLADIVDEAEDCISELHLNPSEVVELTMSRVMTPK